MATSSQLRNDTPDHWQSNATQISLHSTSPKHTSHSPYARSQNTNNHRSTSSTLPIDINTSLIPPSMISMNGIPLPPTLHKHKSKSKTTRTYPGTKSRRKTRPNRIPIHSTSPSSLSLSLSRSRSRSRDRNSKQHKTTHITPTVCDLTTKSTTPLSTEESETDSDIEIIDSIIHPQSTPQTNHNDKLSSTNTVNNFERYTMNGIGGKLLRKAGWDGNTNTLYERNGPIQQSEKYGSLQRNYVWKKNGLGYGFNTNRALIYPIFNHNNPTQLQRVRLPQMQSNTLHTAIEILEEDDDDDDVQIVDKCQVTQARLMAIDFDDIIDGIRSEREETTLKYIEKQFSGSKKRIAVTKMVISIKDSYSQTRIDVPVRGRYCKHVQPFDAKCFLMRAKKYRKCAQCNMMIGVHDLVKMVYFKKIFDDIQRDCDGIEKIEIMRNGEWKVVGNGRDERERKEEMSDGFEEDDGVEVVSVKKGKQSVIVLSSDDDDDEIEDDDGNKEREVVDLLDSSESEDSDDEEEEEDEDMTESDDD